MLTGRIIALTVKRRISSTIAAAFVMALVTSAGLAGQAPRYAELPNFHKVNEKLYRGGQPREGGVKKLAELGIKTIINLRGADDLTRAEEAEAKAAGLTYFNIAMPGLSRPTHDQVARVMAILNDEQRWPVFIHCKRGSDRTGTIVALYRISNEEWTDNQAMTEAKRHGMSWLEFGMKDYVSDYYRDRSANRQKPMEKAEQQPIKKIEQN
ncbi:MAG TPA: tyrosine-protein phosphatase [Blastocatellia bacterium]|nr:tyrosine-protein phosphatase [Blastocatellia bacterium]